MAESKFRELSTDFAVKIIKLFFSEINPKGFVKYLSVWNMDSPCEVPDGVKGFILFHFLRKQKISQYNSIISHTEYISLVYI